MKRLCVFLGTVALASCQGGGAEIHRCVDRRIQFGEYLGAVSLVAQHGRVLELHVIGHQDLARTRPMKQDTIFRIYSMTKTVTTVAVLQLAETGAFALDDPLERYLPEFANLRVFIGGTADAAVLRRPTRPLTIRHLLIHSSGFAVSNEESPATATLLQRAAVDDSADLAEYSRRLSRAPLETDPGARHHYDGVPINVLGRLVEVASGMPFDRYLEARIFAPLGMQDTGFTVPLRERGRVAEMTTTDATGRLVASPEYAGRVPGESIRRYPSAAGGLYSTAHDWLRFVQMLLNGGSLDGAQILGRVSVAEMMTNQLPRLEPPASEFRPGAGFGLGGEVVTDPARRGVAGSVGLYGWPGAASTWYFVDPATGLIAILLMQHLPQGLPRDPAKPGTAFYNQAYRSFVHKASP
jgi:CubicO group peptidase (beta-lactamase class C family)